MDTNTEIQTLLHSDRLDEAIAAMNAEVRNNATSIDKRALLAELLCIAGNLERADVILNAISDIDPGAAVGVAMFRQLVRAEQARQQFYSEGRLPEFYAKPDAVMELELRAAVAVREGSLQEAGALLAERETVRSATPVIVDDTPFDDFRDLDDLNAAHVEVLTTTGKYFWIPTSSISTIEFRKPEKRRDLLWRRAHLSVNEGPDGEIFVPTIYFSKDASPGHRLGHMTDFDGSEGGATFGKGLREFLLGDQARTILELNRIQFPNNTAHA
jgi:type VI secretion system protein ImpE